MLVDPHDAEAIRTAIDSLLNSRKLYDDTVSNGFANAAKYDYRKIAEQYLDVYKELDEKR